MITEEQREKILELIRLSYVSCLAVYDVLGDTAVENYATHSNAHPDKSGFRDFPNLMLQPIETRNAERIRRVNAWIDYVNANSITFED